MMGRKMTLSLANLVMGTLLGIVAAKAIAVYFGNENFGEVQFALSALGILFFITDLGMGQAHVKRVSEGRDPGDCFATFAVFKLVSTALFIVVAVVLILGYVFVLGRTIEDTSVVVILFVLLYYIAKSLQEIGQSSFDARLEVARSQLAIFTDTAVRVGLTLVGAGVVAALLFNAGPFLGRISPESPFAAWVRANPASLLAVANAAGAVGAAVVSYLMLRRSLERGRFRWDLLKDYASFAFPLFLTTTIGTIAFHIDGFALGLFLDDASLGLFAQAKRLPLVLAGIGVAASTLLFPTLSAMAAAGNREGIQRSMDRALRYLSVLMTPILLFTAVFASDLIRIFLSNEVVSGAWAMTVLCAYVLLTTLAIPHSNLLLGMDKPKVIARLGITSALSLIVLNLALVPTDIQALGIRLGGLGVNGAAIATCISGAIWYGGVRIATYRLAGYRERAHLWRHLAAGLLMVGILLAVHVWAVPLTRWFHLPLYGMMGALVYLGGLILLREATGDDWRYVKTSLNPMEMLRYVKTELLARRR